MWTQADIDRLKRAIALGSTSVTGSDGRNVQYRSLSEMIDLLEIIKAEVLGPSGGTPNVSLVKFTRK